MAVSLPFTVVFQRYHGTLNLPTLVGPPFFLSSLSITDISLALVRLYEICFLSSSPIASSLYSFTSQFNTKVPYYVYLSSMYFYIRLSFQHRGTSIRFASTNCC
jgi:hypothetical protein